MSETGLPLDRKVNCVYWQNACAQPALRPIGTDRISIDGQVIPVTTEILASTPFCNLYEFSASTATASTPRVLLVAPLSGHFAALLREVVLGLLPTYRVAITNWINAAHIPLEAGDFGFEDNIATILDMMAVVGPGTPVIATCQAVVPAMAAAAIAAASGGYPEPSALILIAGPVDPTANPTRVVRLARERSMEWFEDALIAEVPAGLAGAGRKVYPGATQLSALRLYWMRHVWEGRELCTKTYADDGVDPWRFPFMDLYSQLMDLPSAYFLENVRLVFHQCAISRGEMRWRNSRIDCAALRQTALMTIEGEDDDIAAPGQTLAAHRLCESVPDERRAHMLVPACGHFSLVYGRTWWSTVRPGILGFLHGMA